jgi:hypothetical protein
MLIYDACWKNIKRRMYLKDGKFMLPPPVTTHNRGFLRPNLLNKRTA